MFSLKRSLVGLAALLSCGQAFADFDGPAPIAWRWADRIAARPSGSPTIVGDRAYAAVGSRMYCLDRATGNQIWRFPAGEPLQANFVSGASVSGNLMIAAADDRALYAVDVATGEKVWQYNAEDGIFSRPVVAGNTVVLGLASNKLIALDLKTGQPVWSEPYAPTSGIYDSMVTWGNYVIFLTSDGMLTALDVTTKRPAWRPKQFQAISPLNGLTVFGDNIYVTSGVYLTALHVGTGRTRFETVVQGTLRYNAAVGPEGIVCVTDDGRMHTFTPQGRPAFRSGIDLGSGVAASPSFVGKYVVIPTSNGSLNMLDPFSGQVIWNFTVPPMIKGMKVSVTTGSGGGGGGGGRGGGALGGGGGALGGGQTGTTEMEIKFVVAAGPAVTEGDTLMLLCQDGSIVAFDKNLGVDLTPPDIAMIWPNSGDQVSGRAPMELIFTVTDSGSGVNFHGSGVGDQDNKGVRVTINGNEYVHEVDRDGRVHVRIISSAGPNFPLADGRARVSVSASDWMGNTTAANFILTIDNTLPPLGSPKLPESSTTGGNTGGPSFGGGGGRGGGLGGGG